MADELFCCSLISRICCSEQLYHLWPLQNMVSVLVCNQLSCVTSYRVLDVSNWCTYVRIGTQMDVIPVNVSYICTIIWFFDQLAAMLPNEMTQFQKKSHGNWNIARESLYLSQSHKMLSFTDCKLRSGQNIVRIDYFISYPR